MIVRQGFPELLQRPFRRGMGRDVLVKNLAGSDLHDNEDVEGPNVAVITTKKSQATITLEWLWTKVSQRCFGSGVRTGVSLRRYLPTVRGGDPNGELQVQLIGDAFLP